MGNASYRNRDYLFGVDRRMVEALDDILAALNNAARQVTASPAGVTGAPPQISSLDVDAADGVFDAAIADNNPVLRGINYFLEYSATVNFTAPVVIDLGASRNWRGYLGNQTLYFRAYSSYPTSPSSPAIYFGSPTAVVGGGSAGPSPLPSRGSGTAPDDGTDGNSGFGAEPYRGALPPRLL